MSNFVMFFNILQFSAPIRAPAIDIWLWWMAIDFVIGMPLFIHQFDYILFELPINCKFHNKMWKQKHLINQLNTFNNNNEKTNNKYYMYLVNTELCTSLQISFYFILFFLLLLFFQLVLSFFQKNKREKTEREFK